MEKNLDHFAIVIGIDLYPGLHPLTASVNDATRFCKWLLSPEGGYLPPENVKLVVPDPAPVTDYLDATPNKARIQKALRALGVDTKQKIGTRLYFYFSGHGISPTVNDVGMLLANSSHTILENNIGLQPYRNFFHAKKLFDEVIYIVDCCRDIKAGISMDGPGFNIADGTGPVINDCGYLATAYGEKAFQPLPKGSSKDERTGLLTKAVIEALEGNPKALDFLGRVTASTLNIYLKERVPELATTAGLKQPPYYIEPSSEIVLAALPPEKLPKVLVRITAPPTLTGDLILLDSQRNVIESKPAAEATKDNPWEKELIHHRFPYILNHSLVEYNRSLVLGDAKNGVYEVKVPQLL